MINHVRFNMALLATLMLAVPLHGQAQNMGNGGTTFSSLEAPTKPGALLGRFVELVHADAQANATLVQALGGPASAGASIGAVQALDMTATPADIGNAAAAAARMHEALTQQMGTQPALTDAGKAEFASGAAALTSAAFDLTALTRNLGATKQVLMTAGPSGRVAVYAARAIPELAAQLRAEVKAMLAFAKVNNITLAPEVAAAAEAMSQGS